LSGLQLDLQFKHCLLGLQAYDIGRRANDDLETHGIVNIILTDQSRLRYALLVIMTAVLKT